MLKQQLFQSSLLVRNRRIRQLPYNLFKMTAFRTLCIFFIFNIHQGSCAAALLDGNSDGDASCHLHTIPKNGNYLVLATDNQNPTAGDIVPNGTVLYYMCNPGFKPVQSATAICLEKEWLTEFTKCQPTKTCNLPEVLQNGQYYTMIDGAPTVGTPGQLVPEWAPLIFTCDPLHEVIGTNVSLCRDGAWSTKPPTCQKNKHCLMPERPLNGYYVIVGNEQTPVPGTETKEFTVLNYHCYDGFKLTDGRVTVCKEGDWIGGTPTCVANVLS